MAAERAAWPCRSGGCAAGGSRLVLGPRDLAPRPGSRLPQAENALSRPGFGAVTAPQASVGRTVLSSRAWILRSGRLAFFRLLIALEEFLIGLCTSSSKRARRLALCLLLAVMLVATAALLAMGCSHQWRQPWDSALMLEGAWRVLQGQRPHVDFFSHIGVVPFLIVALGMKVAAPCGAALTAGYALLLPLVALWAWSQASQRVPAVQALLFSALTGFLIVGTRPLGHDFNLTSYAMAYNRFAWALLGILLLQLSVPLAGRSSRRVAFFNGASAGALLGLLLFTKISYFGLGAAALVVCGFLVPRARPRWPAVAVGCIAVSLPLLAFMRWDVAAYVRDIQQVTAVQGVACRFGVFWKASVANTDVLLQTLLLVLILTKPVLEAQSAAGLASWPKTVVIAGTVVVFGLAACSTNAQEQEIPLFAVSALVLSDTLRRRVTQRDDPCTPRGTGRRHRGGFRYLLANVVILHVAGATLVADASSVGYSFLWGRLKAAQMPDGARLRAAPVADMIFPPPEEHRGMTESDMVALIDETLEGRHGYAHFSPYSYACWVNNGLDLLRRHATPHSRVWTMAFCNPFTFALGLHSPRGDCFFWLKGWMMDRDHYPAADRVLREVTLIMEPKRPLVLGNRRLLKNVYRDYMTRHFRKLDETALWILYRRVDAPAGAPEAGD